VAKVETAIRRTPALTHSPTADVGAGKQCDGQS
jgi:hypothetical protein